MTRTISLADDAYNLLAAAKQPDESFSDVARRLAQRELARVALFDASLRIEFDAAQAEEWKRGLRRAREESASPRVDP